MRCCINPHLFETFAVTIFGTLFVRVLSYNCPSLLCSKRPELQELIEWVLAFVIRRDSRVDRNLHALFHKRPLSRLRKFPACNSRLS